MRRESKTQPLTAAGFAPFGDVLDFSGAPDKLINQGLCGRYHDRATLVHHDGRAGISLFDAAARQLPYRLEMQTAWSWRRLTKSSDESLDLVSPVQSLDSSESEPLPRVCQRPVKEREQETVPLQPASCLETGTLWTRCSLEVAGVSLAHQFQNIIFATMLRSFRGRGRRAP